MGFFSVLGYEWNEPLFFDLNLHGTCMVEKKIRGDLAQEETRLELLLGKRD